MDVDHDDDGAAVSKSGSEEMAMQTKHFIKKEPAVASALKRIHIPTKKKQNSGGDGSFYGR